MTWRVNKEVLAKQKEGLEILIWQSDEAFASTRIGAQNRITDTVYAEQSGSVVYVSNDGKHSTYSMEKGQNLNDVILVAAKNAESIPPLPWYKGFPRIEHKTLVSTGKLLNSEQRATILRKFRDALVPQGWYLSGVVVSSTYKGWIASSTGDRYLRRKTEYKGRQSVISMAVTNTDNTIEASVGGVSTGMRGLRPESLIARLSNEMRFQESLPLRSLKPGAYPVVLGDRAIAEMIGFLNGYGLYGPFCHEGRSFLSGIPPGTQICSPNITLAERIRHPANPGAAPSIGWSTKAPSRTAFITAGKFVQPWYSWIDAIRYGVGVPVVPSNLALSPGRGPSDLEGAAKALGDGLIVNALDYTRAVNSRSGEFVSVGRFGTYRVQNGKVVARVPNLRVMDTILGILSDVRWLSKERVALHATEHDGFEPHPTFLVPRYMQIGSLNVTGTTPIDQFRR